MSENKKKSDTPKTDSKEKAKDKTKSGNLSAAETKKQDTKTNPVSVHSVPKSNTPRKKRGGLLGKRTKRLNFPIETLARRTGTDAVTLGALRVAYGWTKQTRLSQAEFLRLVDAWLKRPVKEA